MCKHFLLIIKMNLQKNTTKLSFRDLIFSNIFRLTSSIWSLTAWTLGSVIHSSISSSSNSSPRKNNLNSNIQQINYLKLFLFWPKLAKIGSFNAGLGTQNGSTFLFDEISLSNTGWWSENYYKKSYIKNYFKIHF